MELRRCFRCAAAAGGGDLERPLTEIWMAILTKGFNGEEAVWM
jgi:hypothetical protein